MAALSVPFYHEHPNYCTLLLTQESSCHHCHCHRHPCKVHIQTHQQYYTTESFHCFRIFCKLFSFGCYVLCCKPSSCLLHSPTHSLIHEIHGFVVTKFPLRTKTPYRTIFLIKTHSANSRFL